MKTTLMTCLLVLSVVAGVARAQPAKPPEPKRFGSMVYPAAGNIDLDEGTVEMWVIANSDTSIHTTNNLVFFDIRHAEGTHFYFGALNIGVQPKSISMIGFTVPRHSFVWGGALLWKPGDVHYVAFSWKGKLRSIYIDGKPVERGPLEPALQSETGIRSSKDVTVEGWLYGNLTTTQLLVGMQHSPFTVDELRVSSVERSLEEIAAVYASRAPLPPDAYTLLLDHCDGGPAAMVSGFSGETGAQFLGSYKVVDGAIGKAIQLWTE
jgi:hypothetical protein